MLSLVFNFHHLMFPFSASLYELIKIFGQSNASLYNKGEHFNEFVVNWDKNISVASSFNLA